MMNTSNSRTAAIRPTVRYQTQVGTSIWVAVVATNAVTGGTFRSQRGGRRSLPPREVRTGSPGRYAARLAQPVRQATVMTRTPRVGILPSDDQNQSPRLWPTPPTRGHG